MLMSGENAYVGGRLKWARITACARQSFFEAQGGRRVHGLLFRFDDRLV